MQEFNETLMIPFIEEEMKDTWGWTIVHCPEYCESEFEIAELQDGKVFGQTNNEDITQYVRSYMPIIQYL